MTVSEVSQKVRNAIVAMFRKSLLPTCTAEVTETDVGLISCLFSVDLDVVFEKKKYMCKCNHVTSLCFFPDTKRSRVPVL